MAICARAAATGVANVTWLPATVGERRCEKLELLALVLTALGDCKGVRRLEGKSWSAVNTGRRWKCGYKRGCNERESSEVEDLHRRKIVRVKDLVMKRQV
jgi:hypothetical protein